MKLQLNLTNAINIMDYSQDRWSTQMVRVKVYGGQQEM
jgi:hypothetical protein